MKTKTEPTYKPQPHHVGAIAHLLRNPASGLLMVPGAGKTGCVLSAFYILKKKGIIDRLCVVAPLRPCFSVWPAEIEKWNFPFSHEILHEDGNGRTLRGKRPDISIINYDGLSWLSQNFQEFMHGQRVWLVLDESTKVKHTNTQRFKTLRPLLTKFYRRTILTGTPAPNGLMDLFGQVYAVDLGERLGSYITQYRREYFYPTGYGGYTWMPQEDAQQRIYKKLEGAFYHVDDSVLKLKKCVPNIIKVKLPKKAAKMYSDFKVEFITKLDSGVVTAANAGVLTNKLRQIANGILYDNENIAHQIHNAKLDALVDLIEQLQGDPLLVGFEFTAEAKFIAAALPKSSYAIVQGGMSQKVTLEILQEFNRGNLAALLCQSDAGAHGLNLQEKCHTLCRYGTTWNLETDIQFRKRVHRTGQTRLVTDHRIIAEGTIDETMVGVLFKKNVVQNDFLAAIKRRQF